MSLRKTERMMQPPRHIRAIEGLLSFHLYSLAAWVDISERGCKFETKCYTSCINIKPCAYEIIFDAYRACSRSSRNCSLFPSNLLDRPTNWRTLEAWVRSALMDERQRASTASAISV